MRPIRLMVVVYVLFCETYKQVVANAKKPTHKQESGKPQPHKPTLRLATHLFFANAQNKKRQ